MTRRVSRQIGRLMGQNLKRLRTERGWTQGELAERTGTHGRYISMMERGRGIGRDLLDRLCTAFEVDEEAFKRPVEQEDRTTIDKLPTVTRMILTELETMPEYEQLRLLADIVEKKFRKLEALLEEQGYPPNGGGCS